MLTPYWQTDFVIIETITIFPVYVALIIDIWVARRKQSVFRSPYYTLVISQGLADVLTIVIIINLLLARYFSISNEVTFNLEFMASVHSNTGPLLFTIRMFGVFLITAQRYLAVCRPNGSLNMVLSNLHPLLLVSIHWLLPCLIYTPAFWLSDAHFDNSQTLFIINTQVHMQAFSVIVTSSFLIVGLMVVVLYCSILRILFITRKNGETSKHPGSMVVFRHHSLRYQEVRLAVHVLLLSIMSVLTFCYYLMEFILAKSPVDSGRRALRIYYPLVSGNFSYINPITLLALNRDVQKLIKRQLCCRQTDAPASHNVAWHHNNTSG